MATQAKRGRVSCRWLVPGPPLFPAPRAAPPAVGPAKGSPPLPPSGHLRLSGSPLPHPKPFLRARRHRPRPQRAFRGGASPLGSVVSGGRACGRRSPGPGSSGRLLELVPARGAGAESQGEWEWGWRCGGRWGRGARRGPALIDCSSRSGGGEPAGHGRRLRHGGPGERAARGVAVRCAAGRAPVTTHLLNQWPAGARWACQRGWDTAAGPRATLAISPPVSLRTRRAAESVRLGAAAAGAAARAAGPGLALDPLLCALARAGQLGAPHVLVRAVGGAGERRHSSLAPTVLACISPSRACEGNLGGGLLQARRGAPAVAAGHRGT